MPLILLYLFRAAKGLRPWASSILSGFFLGLSWLSGDYRTSLLLTIAAAGIWLWFSIRDRQIARLAAASLATAVFASALQTLPLAEYAHFNKRGGPLLPPLFALGIGLLVAIGIDRLPLPENYNWSRWIGRLLLATAAVLTLAGMVLSGRTPQGGGRILIAALSAVLAAGILAGWRTGGISPRAGAVAALGLVLFQLADLSSYQLPNRFVPAQNPYLHRIAEHGDLAAFIRNRGIAARVEYDKNEIPYDFGNWYGLETFASAPDRRDFFGIRYYIGKTSDQSGFKDMFTGRSGLKVFENISAYPRVWSVHPATSLPAGEPTPDLGSCQPREEVVNMPLHQASHVRITANLKCRGMVILTDSWYPGWRAKVDGKSARIYDVYGGVRGVVVDAGQHVIEMRYRPWSVILGGLMTALAGAVTLMFGRRDA